MGGNRGDHLWTVITSHLINLECWIRYHWKEEILLNILIKSFFSFGHFIAHKKLFSFYSFLNFETTFSKRPFFLHSHSYNLGSNDPTKLKLVSFQSRGFRDSNDAKKVLIWPFLLPWNERKPKCFLFSKNPHNIFAFWPNFFHSHSHNLSSNDPTKLKMVSF